MPENLNDDDPMGSTLAAVAVIAAYIDRDEERLDALLAPGENVTAIVQKILWFTEQLLIAGSQGHPHLVLDQLRGKLLRHIAAEDDGRSTS